MKFTIVLSGGRLLLRSAMTLALLCMLAGRAWAETNTPAAILQDLRNFREMGSVLYVAAHPDDENTLLIAYLARGRDYRTAYLSLTRGDGGQNVLGPEFGEKLGVARTQELLAARRLDGGEQFFSRAMDFGFSKDYKETLRIWDEKEVTSDIVRVIREFRPDVVITRFAPWPTGTHGHHTASAYLTVQAFKLAGDPQAFPEQGLPPWQPKRLLWNGLGGNETNAVHMQISGNDPVSGLGFVELSVRSRAMHKTQGFDGFGGYGGGRGPRTETFQLLAGEPMTNDIMDGVDTTWRRLDETNTPGYGWAIQGMIDDIIAKFNTNDPTASVDDIAYLHYCLQHFMNHDDTPKNVQTTVQAKLPLLDKILADCLGLEARTTIAEAEVVPGETLHLHHTLVTHTKIPERLRNDIKFGWFMTSYPSINKKVPVGGGMNLRDLSPDHPLTFDDEETLPTNAPLSQPYWLREDSTAGMFQVADQTLIGKAENPPVFPIEESIALGGGCVITIPDAPVQETTNSAEIKKYRRLDVIPPVSLKLSSDVLLFAPSGTNTVTVEITAARDGMAGTLQLEGPAEWQVAPAQQAFQLGKAGDRAEFQFTVTAPAKATTAKMVACAEIGGVKYRNAREGIDYPHIPLQLLQPVASVKVVSLDLAIHGKAVGYLPGAGDSIAKDLTQMGYHVTVLDDEEVTTDQLSKFDAIVTGIRAFNVRTNLPAYLPALFDYVQNGGTLVEQYNRPDGLRGGQPTPFNLHLSNSRVTDETAEMTFLAPDHPVLNVPNKITAADFDGWIQERGIYFPDQWDDQFTPILACHDPGEAPLKGSLLVASYGKGHIVYTGLVFFRQLPAGVPGAYRLFANLVSLGK